MPASPRITGSAPRPLTGGESPLPVNQREPIKRERSSSGSFSDGDLPSFKRARQLSPEADRSALRLCGAPVSDLSTLNPAELVGLRSASDTGNGVSLNFRTRQIQLAFEIEKLKARQSNDKTTVDEEISSATESVARLVELSETAASYRTHDVAGATHTADPVHELVRRCESSVMEAVTPATLESLSAAVEIRQSAGQLSLQRSSVKQSLDVSKIEDSPSTVFVLNGNNDEGYVEKLGEQLAHLKQVTFIVSGFGGHGTTDSYPVRTDQTEADRFAQLLRKAGIDRRQIVIEPFSTNSGENARYVGQLLSRKPNPSDEPIDIVVCGTPAAVVRQTLTYVAQMPHDGKRTINFKAAPRVPLDAYKNATDSLATLRECFTLLNYLHNTDYLPRATQFANADEYSAMMTAIGTEPVKAIRRFRNAVLAMPADATGSALFTDGDKSFSLQDAMRDISFVDERDFGQRATTAGSLSPERMQALQRAHRAVSKMFEAVEIKFERDPSGIATPERPSD